MPHSFIPGRPRRKGIALILVLFSLVVLTIMIVSFFSSATSNRKSAALYQSSEAAKRLADTTINLVVAQIREATTQNGTAWASQPGAIRTYDDDGDFTKGFKLYSSGNMTETIESGMTTADLPPANWASQPALFTDLNSPVRTASGNMSFPIIDGNGMTTGTDPVSGTSAYVYNNSTTPRPPLGFSVTRSADALSAYSAAAAVSASNNPVPMPVRWLYVLQNGTIVAPAASGSNPTVSGASKSNPIVGRIAFWTDDETAKININTASYDSDNYSVTANGSDNLTNYHAYHSPPYFYGNAEFQLARFQPRRGEFQRYPGHPATTNLGIVFPSLSANAVFDLVPKVNSNNSSLGGTRYITGNVTADLDRLYATTGELLYTGNRSLNPPSSGNFTADLIERSRFFITARSRAPELNLYGKPRVSIWPVSLDNSANSRTGFDQLAAFASTLKISNSFSVYYLRRNTQAAGGYRSPTLDQQIDTNQKLFGNPNNNSYLQYLFTQPIPGFGGNFSAKFGDDRHQILTLIQDYIRCVNTNDPLLSLSNQYTPGHPIGALTRDATYGFRNVTPLFNEYNDTMGFGRTFTIPGVALQFICTADGSAGTFSTPSDPSYRYPNPMPNPTPAYIYKQMSNYASTNNTTAVIYGNGTAGTISPVARNLTLNANQTLSINERRVQALLLLHPFSPIGMGVPRYEIEIDGLENFSLGGQPLNFPSNNSGNATLMAPSTAMEHRDTCRTFINNGRRLPARTPMSADSGLSANNQNSYPYVSSPVTVSGNTTDFSGGNITISLYSGNGSSKQLYQRITASFPSLTAMPVPTLFTGNSSGTWSNLGTANRTLATSTPEAFWTFHRDGVGIPGSNRGLDRSNINASINPPPRSLLHAAGQQQWNILRWNYAFYYKQR